ncbi:MAG: hypothetical protein R3249_06265, partial [Nitriliruptorales bacterium]|nr:hypothetical protein [Nitriliruptorales bacterium]
GELLPLAERLGHANALVLVHRALAALAIIDGDLDKAKGHASEDERVCTEQGFPWIVQAWAFQAHHAVLAGEWELADELARKAVASDVPGAFAGIGASAAAWVAAIRGDRGSVLRLHREFLEPVLGVDVPFVGRRGLLNHLALALAWIGDRETLARLQPGLQEVLATGDVIMPWITLPQRLGVALTTAAIGQWEQAHADMAAARATAEELGMRPGWTGLDLWDAWLHLEQGGDALAQVPGLLEAAVAAFEADGMERHLELVDQLRERLAAVS